MKLGDYGQGRTPKADTPAGKILLSHWREALISRHFHRQRGELGKIEAMLAAHKMFWLEKLIAEIEQQPP